MLKQGVLLWALLWFSATHAHSVLQPIILPQSTEHSYSINVPSNSLVSFETKRETTLKSQLLNINAHQDTLRYVRASKHPFLKGLYLELQKSHTFLGQRSSYNSYFDTSNNRYNLSQFVSYKNRLWLKVGIQSQSQAHYTLQLLPIRPLSVGFFDTAKAHTQTLNFSQDSFSFNSSNTFTQRNRGVFWIVKPFEGFSLETRYSDRGIDPKASQQQFKVSSRFKSSQRNYLAAYRMNKHLFRLSFKNMQSSGKINVSSSFINLKHSLNEYMFSYDGPFRVSFGQNHYALSDINASVLPGQSDFENLLFSYIYRSRAVETRTNHMTLGLGDLNKYWLNASLLRIHLGGSLDEYTKIIILNYDKTYELETEHIDAFNIELGFKKTFVGAYTLQASVSQLIPFYTKKRTLPPTQTTPSDSTGDILNSSSSSSRVTGGNQVRLKLVKTF